MSNQELFAWMTLWTSVAMNTSWQRTAFWGMVVIWYWYLCFGNFVVKM